VSELDPVALHRELRGKIAITPTTKVTQEALALLYTPGVAKASRAIEADPRESFALTRRWNMCAIVSDGTRVLGLGPVGPEAAMPVMEGKELIFKHYGDVDAIPLCVTATTADEIVTFCKQIQPTFGAINLEDIETPKVFEIEERLRAELAIPVFHDDQYGTGTVVLAGLINAAKVVGKELAALNIVIAGAGAAGLGIAKLLLAAGATGLTLTDSKGALYKGRDHMDPFKTRIAENTNLDQKRGSLEEVLKGADAVVAVTGRPGLLTAAHIKTMAAQPIVFALTNPDPDILPDEARAGGAAVTATGRSDFANQINNSLIFPGVLRGVLDSRVRSIELPALVRAAQALAHLVHTPSADQIVPLMSDKRIAPAVAAAMVRR
jgi:malate dehydrogenase (oxaloacetate-decarboxylating)